VAKVGTNNPDRTISLKGCSAYLYKQTGKLDALVSEIYSWSVVEQAVN